MKAKRYIILGADSEISGSWTVLLSTDSGDLLLDNLEDLAKTRDPTPIIVLDTSFYAALPGEYLK